MRLLFKPQEGQARTHPKKAGGAGEGGGCRGHPKIGVKKNATTSSLWQQINMTEYVWWRKRNDIRIRTDNKRRIKG